MHGGAGLSANLVILVHKLHIIGTDCILVWSWFVWGHGDWCLQIQIAICTLPVSFVQLEAGGGEGSGDNSDSVCSMCQRERQVQIPFFCDFSGKIQKYKNTLIS